MWNRFNDFGEVHSYLCLHDICSSFQAEKAHLTFMFPKSYKLNITNPFTFIRTIQLNLNYEQVFYNHRTICLKCIKHIAEKRRPKDIKNFSNDFQFACKSFKVQTTVNCWNNHRNENWERFCNWLNCVELEQFDT